MVANKRVIEAFSSKFGEKPKFLVRAPGRVNIIGEHTDYNDGFVFPAAIDRAIWIAFRPRQDDKVCLRSLDFPENVEFSLKNIRHGESWGEYIRGTAWALQENGYALHGWEGVLGSDIPVGAGLSSSAALELGIARVFQHLGGWAWDANKMGKVAKSTENDWLGLQSGIMDQMAVAHGKKDNALLLDCRDLSITRIPFPAGYNLVVMDTATRRGLVNSAYNQRVAECQKASDFFNLPSLRDLSIAKFNAEKKNLPAIIQKRVQHVLHENERVHRAADAMEKGNVVKLGSLLSQSHQSLRDNYEVSSHELNLIVDIAEAQSGCLGARMTGAGFGGCALAMVEKDAVPNFIAQTAKAYQEKSGLKAQLYPCLPSAGVEVLPTDTAP